MSQLDDELARAVAEQAPLAPAERVHQEPRPARNLGLLLVLLGFGTIVLILVYGSLKGAVVYSKGVDELLSQRAQLGDRILRVEGKLVAGSLRRRDSPCEYRFELTKNGATIPVRYSQCIVPDTFRDVPGMEVNVTAEGQLAAAGYFQARQIMAKCPSKYEEQVQNGVSVPYDRPIPSFQSETGEAASQP